jgi:hypothetical protein
MFVARPPYAEAAEALLEEMPDLGFALFLWQQEHGRIKSENGRFQALIDKLIKSPDEYRRRFNSMMDAA